MRRLRGFGENIQVVGSDNTIGKAANAQGSIVFGRQNTIDANFAIAIGTGNTVSALNGIALGSGAQIAGGGVNSVAIGAGSVASAPNTLSVGSAGNERRITNVAPGIAPSDAATFGQVSSIAAGLQTQIDDTRREARAGTALTLAAAGLRYDDRPGKASLAAAFGHFKGESGLAVGLGYNYGTQLRFNAALTGAPNVGDYGMTVGAAWTVN